ncbi:hypothetical protein GCM10022239_25730 [Leifsonia bigeumensis]|uniref:TIGR03943 family protein n=1 Tax=Leifsonella bigeumensis TaxID=433643 RepID=A0ABP7FX32_9MICO
MSPRHRTRRDWRRWNGIALTAATIVATVWLATTNQLLLYIHPRYIVFTVIMAAFGLVFLVASFVPRSRHGHDHDHETQDEASASSGLRRWITASATIVTAAIALALVIVPPATLTSATADQREINSTNVLDTPQSADAVAPAGASERFTVRDWASLLRQTSDPVFYSGKPADVVGFVTPDPDDPENVFYVSRFIITCCAVDAQPIGVPVYLPDWTSSFHKDDWVQVTGGFETNPSAASAQPIALVPTSTKTVQQPDEPYLY